MVPSSSGGGSTVLSSKFSISSGFRYSGLANAVYIIIIVYFYVVGSYSVCVLSSFVQCVLLATYVLFLLVTACACVYNNNNHSLDGSLLMGFSKPSNVTASSGDWKCTLSSALGRLYNV